MKIHPDITNKKSIKYFNGLEYRFQQTHNNKYNYDKVIFVKATEKIIITCPIHGDFTQTPDCHLRGQGCSVCGHNRNKIKNTKSQDEFINSCSIKHSNFYIYDKTVYNGSHRKIIIICPLHGEFKQAADSHLRGCGCPKCSISAPYSYDDFLVRANEIHSNKYDYNISLDGELTSKNKIEIVCLSHGVFKQHIYNHVILGQGCPKCNKSAKLSQDEFVEKSREVHGGFYIYDKVNYTGWDSKVIITCMIHGDFEQTPNSHLQGCGCYWCGVAKNMNYTNYSRYKDKPTTLYYVKINDMYKIGITKKSINVRFQKDVKLGVGVEVIWQREYSDGWEAYTYEQKILDSTFNYRIAREYSPIKDGWTEIRTRDIIEEIKNIIKDNNENNK